MKKIIAIVFILLLNINAFSQSAITFHDYSARTISGDTINLSQYYGKKVLVVNTASFCGYTPQFADLESLYNQYHQYNFEIIGFPCNDFNNQDPNNDSTINDFCTANYGVTFQMMSKIATISADTAPVYKWLQRADLNGVSNAHVAWNFNKFCIDEAGHWVAHHIQTVNPLDQIITDWIMTPSVISAVNAQNSYENNLFEFVSSGFDNASINLKINSTESQEMNISIYSSEGKFITKIFSGIAVSNNQIRFDASLFSAGMYFIKAETANSQQTIKYALLK